MQMVSPESFEFPRGLSSLQSALATRHVYRRTDASFISFNGASEVIEGSPILEKPISNIDYSKLPQIYGPVILSGSYPYVALNVNTPSRDDLVMSRFFFSAESCTRRDEVSTVIRAALEELEDGEDGKKSYRLLPSFRTPWNSFEVVLEDILRVIEEMMDGTRMQGIIRPSAPSTFGYNGTYSTLQECLTGIFCARNAFTLYTSYVVYAALALVDVESRATSVGALPSWARKLVDSGYSEGWLRELLSSQAFTFGKAYQVGTIISPCLCSFLQDIPLFLRAGIPFTVMWRDCEFEKNALSLVQLSAVLKEALRPFPPTIAPHQYPPPPHPNAPDEKGDLSHSDRVEDIALEGAEMPSGNDGPKGNAGFETPMFESFMDYMRFRYGFIFPPHGPEYPNFESWAAPLSDEGFRKIRFQVSDQDTFLEPSQATESLRRHLFHFVNGLSNSDGPPLALWDLHSMNEKHLLATRDGSKVRISMTASTEPTFYGLCVKQNKQEGWTLQVSDPSVAVECLRREFVTTRDIVKLFIRRGTPFTLWYDLPAPPPQLPPPKIINPHSFHHTPEHFLQWEHRARHFILTPRGLLVWKLGGILWRVAFHLQGNVQKVFDLLDAAPGPFTRRITQSSFEEVLTGVEMDIIMGTYHIQPDPTSAHTHSKSISYWPHPNLMAKTNFNCGCWTPENERWFNARLNALRNGTAHPQTSGEWRRSIKGGQVVKARLERLNAAATTFLHKNI